MDRQLGEELTGYHQVTGNFYLGPVDFHRGGECPWAYVNRGIVSFSNECCKAYRPPRYSAGIWVAFFQGCQQHRCGQGT